jgi:ABC-type antimicrobial peptide transport system permease subunit
MSALTARLGRRTTFRLNRRDPLLIVILAVCGLLVAIAGFGTFIAPYDPNATRRGRVRAPRISWGRTPSVATSCRGSWSARD